MARKHSRRYLTWGAVLLIGAGVAYAFWPRPVEVDLGQVTRGAMLLTVDEEARTRVHDAYVVSTPIAGRLLRVEVQPGDYVEKGKSVVARMLPTAPGALDVRTREQARAAVSAAEAALRVAQADLNKSVADRDLAESDLNRSKRLYDSDLISEVALERAEKEMRTADAGVDTARAAISMRVADLENAQARLISFDDPDIFSAGTESDSAIPLPSPISGRVLRVLQQSATTLPAGTPVVEIGDTQGDLEIVVELLSTDAVQVAEGNRVIIDNWGGAEALNGVVERVDPWGFTKYSALGVEEQRVNAVIQFTDPPEARASLGHGFRVEARIVVWEDPDTLIVPSSALFRENGDWRVFAVSEGIATITPVDIGRNNGLDAQVLSGLEEGQEVIVFPAAGLEDGAMVTRRRVN